MTKVKICGLTRAEDIAIVNRAMPDYIGFVFAQSRRKVDESVAARLKEKLDLRIEAVGVFINEDIDTVANLYLSGIIDVVQLHGDEDNQYIRRLKDQCGCKVIKAIGVGDALPDISFDADYLLFDTLSKQRGGIGKAFDWKVLNDYSGTPYFLAGGLGAGNVGDAIDLLNPFCADVSSGVETDGLKDAEKIEEFVNRVRGL